MNQSTGRNSSLRVLAVTNMYPTSEDQAFGSFVADQIKSVVQAGVAVEVLFINGRLGDREYIRGLARLKMLTMHNQFDIVHAHYGLTGYIASFQPLPLVVTFHGDDLNGTSDGRGGLTLKSRAIRWLSHRAARVADGVICVSERLRDSLPRAHDRNRAHVIPNGVDTSLFTPGDRLAARRRLGLSLEERLILFPHSLRQRALKRFDLAEAALRALADLDPKARLWVVNGVPHDRMPDYYRAADCLLLTSMSEGSPMVVKEAICCGVPIVSVDVGDVSVWTSRSPGCRLTSGEPAAIADALAEVLSGPRQVNGNFAREELKMELVAARLVGVYEGVVRSTRLAHGAT